MAHTLKDICMEMSKMHMNADGGGGGWGVFEVGWSRRCGGFEMRIEKLLLRLF